VKFIWLTGFNQKQSSSEQEIVNESDNSGSECVSFDRDTCDTFFKLSDMN
jgi:hypothetical protein